MASTVKSKKQSTLHIAIDEELLSEVEKLAKETYLSKSQIINRAIALYVKLYREIHRYF
ncbi:MAG: ribbon-helix-helix protein, CopG family [Nanopusillaceae archaeon]